jgi:hypothetical protein
MISLAQLFGMWSWLVRRTVFLDDEQPSVGNKMIFMPLFLSC